MTIALISSGYLVAVVVLIVERAQAKQAIKDAYQRGVEAGYHRCLTADESAKTFITKKL